MDSPYWALDPAADRARRSLRRLPAAVGPVEHLLWQAAPGALATVLICQVGAGAAATFGLLQTSDVLARLLAAGPSARHLATALPGIVIVVVALAVRGTLGSVTALAQARIGPAARRLAEGRLTAAALTVDLAAFDDADFHDRLHRGRDRAIFHLERSAGSTVDLIVAVSAVVAALVSLGVLIPLLVPALALALIPDVWATLAAARIGHTATARAVSLERRVRMMSDLATERTAAAEIRACQAEDFVLAEFRTVADAQREVETATALSQARTKTWGRLGTGVALGLLLVLLGVLIDLHAVPLAAAGAVLIAIRMASAALGGAVTAGSQLVEQALYVGDLQAFLVDAAERRPPDGEVIAPQGPRTVELDRVTFHYPGQAVAALSEVTLTIRAGQRIAFVGENGSGKTTLAKMIAGLYRPDTGQVRWDGGDIVTMDRASVADRVVMVLQEPVRWPHDARTNVRIGRHNVDDPDDVRLLAAADHARANTVIESLPDRWRTLLSRQFRGGRDLSGGQWQRVAVARGLFRDAPLLIWDEPTAALDAKAEHAVYESLQRVAAGRTVILITHRLASVRDVDRIFVLDRGRVIEDGTHEELLAKDGEYAALYDLQARMYAPDNSGRTPEGGPDRTVNNSCGDN